MCHRHVLLVHSWQTIIMCVVNPAHHQKPAGRCVTAMFYLSIAGKLDVCKPTHSQKPAERRVTVMFYLYIAGKHFVCKPQVVDTN